MAKDIVSIGGPIKTTPADANYPHGSARDVSSPGAGDGTPLLADWLNQILAFQQRLMDEAGIAYDDVVDTTIASQIYTAYSKIKKIGSAEAVAEVFGNFRMVGEDLVGSSAAFGRFNSASAAGFAVSVMRSRDATPGSFTTVQDDDVIWGMIAQADDGVDYSTIVTGMRFVVTDAVGVGDIVGEWQQLDSALVPRFRIGEQDALAGSYAILGSGTTDPTLPVNYARRMIIEGTSAALVLGDTDSGSRMGLGITASDFDIRDESTVDQSPGTGNRTKWQVQASTGNLRAGSDGIQDFGDASHRAQDIWATNATIQTSDPRWKDKWAPISDAHLTAYYNIDLTTFKWTDAIDKKGKSARSHVGVNAQQVIDVFESQGLDAFEHGMIGKDAIFTYETVGTPHEYEEERERPILKRDDDDKIVLDEKGNEIYLIEKYTAKYMGTKYKTVEHPVLDDEKKQVERLNTRPVEMIYGILAAQKREIEALKAEMEDLKNA